VKTVRSVIASPTRTDSVRIFFWCSFGFKSLPCKIPKGFSRKSSLPYCLDNYLDELTISRTELSSAGILNHITETYSFTKIPTFCHFFIHYFISMILPESGTIRLNPAKFKLSPTKLYCFKIYLLIKFLLIIHP